MTEFADHVTVRGIEGYGYHGVFDFERAAGQPFVVDVDLFLDLSQAGTSDALEDTVDYSVLVAAVKRLIEGSPVNLIETLAHQVAAACLNDERVGRVRVTVHKPQAPVDATFADIAVVIDRSRK
jgi:dihydroneopterin aldolase